MSTISETSDAQLLELLGQRGSMTVSEMARSTEVTSTAVRQRLTRLMAQGLVDRHVARSGRGRPRHRYSLTEKARRQSGSNYSDLALMLWDEIRSIKDLEVRRGLLQRIAGAMAHLYGHEVVGTTTADRMESLKELFARRRVPMQVDKTSEFPVLTVVNCPYPELADKDSGICAVEKMLFSELLSSPVRLSQCRLDGHSCCQFESN